MPILPESSVSSTRVGLTLAVCLLVAACGPGSTSPPPSEPTPERTPPTTRPPSALAAALAPQTTPTPPDDPPPEAAARPLTPEVVNTRREPRRPSRTVGELIHARQCSTGPAFRLNAQIAAEVNCVEPGAFAYIDDIPNVRFNHGANPFLQSSAADALRRVAATAPHAWLPVNSTWRSAVQQHILKRWEGSCGVGLAAPVGHSNHESGLAIDVPLETLYGYHAELAAEGWRWFCASTNRGDLRGCRDVPHHDHRRGADLRRLGVQAFQRLWSHAHPDDPIRITGRFDRPTALRLERAPLAGFAAGTTCGLAFPTWRCPVTFTDVSPRHPRLAAIEAGARAGIWTGCDPAHPDAFCPDASLSRADLAAVLGRALGLQPVAPSGRFTDVPADHPEAGWIEAIAAVGVSPGCQPLKQGDEADPAGAPTRFCPSAPVTRSQAAVWLARSLNLALIDPEGERFKDVPTHYWAAAEVEAFDRAGLHLPGCRRGRFCPGWLPSRAQVASLLVEAFRLPEAPPCERAPIPASGVDDADPHPAN